MDRAQVIAKIKAILNLQNGSDFEGESQAAAHLIDKLCKQYNVTLDEATKTQILDEVFYSFKRINHAYSNLLNAVAEFYDAKLYIHTNLNGDKSLRIVGSEAQQVQVKLYFEYLQEAMEKQCEIAHKAEKILCQVQGTTISRSFKTNFRKAFAYNVALRLRQMKETEGRCHQDAQAVLAKMSEMKLRKARKATGPVGSGAYSGAAAGASVSLNRQATGRTTLALSGR
jgi:hypothetical protein